MSPNDYEWIADVELWISFIERDLHVDRSEFDVYSNKLLSADEAWVLFKNPADQVLFALKAPEDIVRYERLRGQF